MIGLRHLASGQYAELSPETSISLELLNPATQFDSELQGSFSFPFTLPVTPANRALFKQMQRPDSDGSFSFSEDFVLEIGGAQLHGRLTLLEVENRAYSASFSTALGALASEITGKRLRSLEMGGVVQFSLFNSMESYVDNTLIQPLDSLLYCFPMLINRSAFSSSLMPQYTGYLNHYDNAGLGSPGYHNYVLSGPFTGRKQSAFLPCLFLSKVFRYCFSEHGWELEGSILADELFRRTIIVSEYAEERDDDYGTNNQGLAVMASLHLDARNHVPDWTIGEFIVAVCRIFGQAAFFDANRKVCRLEKMSRLRSQGATSFDKMVESSAEGIRAAAGGYTFRHKENKLLAPFEDSTEGGNLRALLGDNDFSIQGNPSGVTGEIRYDTSRNIFREKGGTYWYKVSENGRPMIYGDGSTEVSVNWLPILQYPSPAESVKGDVLDLGGWEGSVFSPARTPGTDHKPDTLRLAQWWGLQPGPNEYSIPTAYSFNIRRGGGKLGSGSLHWYGSEGVCARYWEGWCTHTGGKIVRYTAQLSAAEIAELDFARPVHIDNQSYLIHKISVSISAGGVSPSTIELFQL